MYDRDVKQTIFGWEIKIGELACLIELIRDQVGENLSRSPETQTCQDMIYALTAGAAAMCEDLLNAMDIIQEQSVLEAHQNRRSETAHAHRPTA